MIALVVPATALAPVAAFGEPSKKLAAAPPDKADRYDPDNVTAISQYMEAIAKGIERYRAKDYAAANESFSKAVQLGPKRALAHCLLAESHLRGNNSQEAQAAIAQALSSHDTAKDPALRSRVLFLAAEIHERQKEWQKAKVAWQAYAEHTAKFGDAGYPQTGAERLKAIQRVLDMETPYAAVRERIAADKDGGAKGAPPQKP